MISVSDERFDELIDKGIELIPEPLLRNMNNVALVVEPWNRDNPNTLGLYEGVALTRRTPSYSFALPDKITIYKEAICAYCNSEEELVRQVAVTVVHEIGHHFGIDDDRLHELGWA